MMNNMAHVLQFLDYVPQALEYSKILNAMIVVHGEDRLEQLEATLRNILICAKDDMHNRLDQIISHVGRRVSKFS